MRIKHLILPMFMTVMGMAFTSCKDDDMTCKDCKKEMAVTIDVVDANGMPMSRGTGDGVGYTVYGAGTYETSETPTVGATAKAGYKITKFDKWTEKNGLEVLVSTETKQVSDVAKGSLGNHSYTVTVEAEKKFTNTVKAGTGGSASGTYTGITGASHSISASPDSGYKFKNWTWSGTGVTVTNANSASTTATIGSSDGTITANFEKNAPQMYSVSVSYPRNQIIGISMKGIKEGKSTEWVRGSSGSFDAGTTVYVTAEKTENCHSHKLQWKNLNTGTDWGNEATISFTLNDNMRFSVTAPY